MDEVEVTEGVGQGSYNVLSSYSGDVAGMNAQELLDLAEWIELNRDQLEREAREDKEHA